MCGVTGYVSLSSPIDVNTFYGHHNRIAHRGPDDEGFFHYFRGVGVHAVGPRSRVDAEDAPHVMTLGPAQLLMGHHRLNVLDLTVAARQPLMFEHLVLSYNGEIYNHADVRAELQAAGYEFRSRSDSEVLLKAWHHWGSRCLEHLTGMWAFAIFDTDSEIMFLCRDRFGEKPLFYVQDAGRLFFASECKVFPEPLRDRMNHPAVNAFINRSMVTHGGLTMFEGVHQVPAATVTSFDMTGRILSTQQYWTLNTNALHDGQDVESSAVAFLQRLDDSVRLRLGADVPVGVMLSGGLDSTAIAASILRQRPKSELHTYSSVFDEAAFSEHVDIRAFIRQSDGVIPTFVSYAAEEALDRIRDVLWHQEVPVRSLASVSQFLLYERVAFEDVVTVLLNGQGADEAFGGYTRYNGQYLVELLLRGRLPALLRETTALRRHDAFRLRANVVGLAKLVVQTLVGPAMMRKNPVRGLQKHQIEVSALPEYLHYEDRNSMAFGRESRLPFLDHELVDWAVSLASDQKIREGERKYVMRQALDGTLPDSIVRGRVKRGFVSPQELWQVQDPLRGWVEERLYEAQHQGFDVDRSRIAGFRSWRAACLIEWQSVMGIKPI